MTRMTLEQFNSAEEDAAERLLLACAAVPRWARAVAAGRPYASRDALLDAARTAASPWTEEEVDAALARPPRIGERAEGQDADAAHSRREQSGVDTADADVAAPPPARPPRRGPGRRATPPRPATRGWGSGPRGRAPTPPTPAASSPGWTPPTPPSPSGSAPGTAPTGSGSATSSSSAPRAAAPRR